MLFFLGKKPPRRDCTGVVCVCAAAQLSAIQQGLRTTGVSWGHRKQHAGGLLDFQPSVGGYARMPPRNNATKAWLCPRASRLRLDDIENG